MKGLASRTAGAVVWIALCIAGCSGSTSPSPDAGNEADSAGASSSSGATSSGSGGSGACPQGLYPPCNTDADCPCTHLCSPLVPNGINKSCTIGCTQASDCNRPELGITCPAGDNSCCLAGVNVCLPS
jgi:hypothetical protein